MESLKDDYKTLTRDHPEKITWVLKLERSQQDVGQLRNKLNSYVCEPKTYLLFERRQSLKSGLDAWMRTNREIIVALREHQRNMGEHMERIHRQFAKFNELQQGVDDYMEGLRSY